MKKQLKAYVNKQLKRKSWLLRHYSERSVVAGLMAIAIGMRFATIAKASIWHDEGFSMMLSARNPADIWIGSAHDVHPPLYYEILHFWTSLFGRSEFAARGLSAVAGLITIFVAYKLIRHILGRGAATVTLAVLAIAPMAVRYSQEARMYGILGLWLVGATYALVLALENRKQAKHWIIYAVLMAAGLYTHYFTVFALAAHWIYLLVQTRPDQLKIGKTAWLTREWWLANIAIVVLWLPWVPNFIGQFTRGQGISWIPAVTSSTLPGGIWQDLTFTDGGQIPSVLFWGVPFLLVLSVCYMVWQYRKKTPQVELIFFYAVVPIALTLLASIFKPIYQDRYLVFATYGVYILISLAIYQLIRMNRVAGMAALLAFCGILVVGNINVVRQASHTMRDVGKFVNERYQPGDEIVSAELYTYFDFSYYCKNCLDARNTQVSQSVAAIYPSPVTTLKLNTSGGRPNGYGESSLLKDRADSIYIDNLTTINPVSKRVWVVGKPGQPYWNTVPVEWKPTLNEIRTNSSEARMYVTP